VPLPTSNDSPPSSSTGSLCHHYNVISCMNLSVIWPQPRTSAGRCHHSLGRAKVTVTWPPKSLRCHGGRPNDRHRWSWLRGRANCGQNVVCQGAKSRSSGARSPFGTALTPQLSPQDRGRWPFIERGPLGRVICTQDTCFPGLGIRSRSTNLLSEAWRCAGTNVPEAVLG